MNDAEYLRIIRLHHPGVYKAAVFQEGIASHVGHMLLGERTDDSEELKMACIAYAATVILASQGEPNARGRA